MAQVVLGHLVGLGQRPVMRVMEQEAIASARGAMAPDRGHQCRIGPFVHQHEIRRIEHPVQVELGVVELTGEGRVRPREPSQHRLALLPEQMGPAPAVRRLEDGDPMPARQQLGGHASEKMGVAVIPVGYQ